MIKACVIVCGIAVMFASGAVGQSPSGPPWKSPDGAYSLSLPAGWQIKTSQTAGEVFTAEPVRRGQNLRECSATARTLPTPPGCEQECLNGSMARFDFSGSKAAVMRRKLKGVAIAEVTHEEDGIWARETAFAVQRGGGATMHQLRCLAIMPINDAEKAELQGVLASLAIEK